MTTESADQFRGLESGSAPPFYAVSGEAGEVTLENVPEGEYELEAWHESLGRRSEKVKVEPKKTTSVTITFRVE